MTGVSVHRLDPQHVATMTSRKAVADLLTEINLAIDKVKRELEDAATMYNTTGRSTSGEWMNAARSKQRRLGVLSQAAQRRLGELNREAKAASQAAPEDDEVARRGAAFAAGVALAGEKRGIAKAIAAIRAWAGETTSTIEQSMYLEIAMRLEHDSEVTQ